jgi:hypothetical protein
MVHLSDNREYFANIEAERLLNGAIVGADIRDGFWEKFDPLDGFYAEDVRMSRQLNKGAVLGKAAVWFRVMALITPLLALTDVDNISISLRAEPVRSHAADETHTCWTLEMSWTTDKRCVLRWRSFRRWRGGRVVYERHHEIEQTCGLLTAEDLSTLTQGGGQEIIH